MKRAHRRAHFALWAILGPAMFWILFLAVQDRPEAPINDQLPAGLTDGAS